MLDDKIQKPGEFLFQFTFGSNIMDQRSGDARPIQGTDFPNFEILDARSASALNKIIQNSHSKKKVSLEEQKAQKEERFL